MNDAMKWTPGMQVATIPPQGGMSRGEVIYENASLVIVDDFSGRHEFDKATRMETLSSLVSGTHNGPLRLQTSEEWRMDRAHREADEFRRRIGDETAPIGWFVNLPRPKRMALIDALDNNDDN